MIVTWLITWPYMQVYTVDIGNQTAVREVVYKVLAQKKFEPFIPHEFTQQVRERHAPPQVQLSPKGLLFTYPYPSPPTVHVLAFLSLPPFLSLSLSLSPSPSLSLSLSPSHSLPFSLSSFLCYRACWRGLVLTWATRTSVMVRIWRWVRQPLLAVLTRTTLLQRPLMDYWQRRVVSGQHLMSTTGEYGTVTKLCTCTFIMYTKLVYKTICIHVHTV